MPEAELCFLSVSNLSPIEMECRMSYFIHDSYSVYYREQGAGPLLVILPGNTASSTAYEGELEYFSARFRVATMDFLGTGQSDRQALWGASWWRNCASQAHGLVRHLGEERCVAMGGSGGGIVALLMAIHHPESVSAVVADSCVEHYPPELLRAEVADRKHPASELKEFWKVAHGRRWQEVVDKDSAMLMGMAEQGGDCFSGRLAQIACPVLLTASRKDSFLDNVSAQLTGMQKQITHCRVSLHDTGGHPLMWTQPNVFRKQADAFLAACSL